jgi:tripartite-type tricarboxylate transporter receptor subunit TctC
MTRTRTLAGLALGLLLHTLTPAQTATPSAQGATGDKPIRIIVPYAPGGFTDIVARLVATRLTERLGQPVVVENKAGASTVLGAQEVAKAPADGHTLLMAVTTTLSTNPFLFKKLPYKSTDFKPVALTGITPFVLVAHPSVPADSMKALVELAKARPGTLNVATLGVGSSTHLVTEMFRSAAGVDVKDIPYKGSGPASNDLLAGHVQLYFDAIPTAMPRIRAGQLKGIAVTADQRSPAAPSLPTFAESGLPGMVAVSWYGLLAPAGTPQAAVDRLNKAVNAALEAPDVKAQIEANGATAPTMSPAEFGALIDRQTRVWERIVAPLNIQLDGGLP